MNTLFLLAALALSPAAAPEDVTAFVNVTVVPMDAERLVPGQTVLIEGDRIVAVGSDVQVPEGALVIDGSGQYLMPGLAEMHGHIPPPNQPAEEIEKTLFLYMANGITTVRGMLGYPGQLDLKAAANAGEIDAPTLYLAGPSFNGGSVNSPAQAADKVRRQVEEGWDLLKIHPGLSKAEFDSMAVTARRSGIDFGGHVPADVGLVHALEMGQLTFDHLDGYVEYLSSIDADAVDTGALADIVARTKAMGAWVVPTMVLWETLYGTNDLDDLNAFPELQYAHPSARASWENAFRQRVANPQFDLQQSRKVIDARMQVLAALNEADAGILMGTDAPQQYSVPGFSLHREMARMEDAGMSPYEVLRSGTVAVGTYFEAWDTFGQVAAGHRADLILVRGNPLEDLAHVADRGGVMVRGRWYAEETIQERLASIAASYRQ
ncbi:MAG: amidohydrolase family protein [Rhodothermales bacterium]|nr:amidohydrolase family protein [Rhodothermales bacterium]MBO6778892.1 amidohydrolase family protein [Rhodothermales bacterium]